METTITISDLNAGTFIFTNTTDPSIAVSYLTPENITLTD